MELSEKKCKACEGWEKPFTKAEAEKYLNQVNNWRLSDNQIEKEFRFKNFKEGLEFVNKVGNIAEEEGHHPDVYLSYRKVIIKLTTHAIKGLSESDFILAAKIDKSF